MIMFTAYIPVVVKPKQPKQQLINTIKYTKPQKQSKIFTAPNLASSCRSANEHENPMNWSYYSFQQKNQAPKRQPSFSSTKVRKLENQPNIDEENKKSYQILIKQSLRRSFTTRKKNKSASDVRNTICLESARMLSQNIQAKNKQDIFDFLKELEGKKCVINKNTKPKSASIQNRTLKSKSLQAKPCVRKQRQLKIEADEQFRQTVLKEALNQPVVALGMAAKKQSFTNTLKNQSHQTSGNKIAISTTQCLIFTEPFSNKSNGSGLYVESQANFVRAKKKSKVLYKKVANFLKQQEDTQPKLVQSRIFEFKNSITKNLNLEINNSQSLAETMKEGRKQKKNTPYKKQQNIKIEGWQTNPGEELQTNF